MLDAINKPQDRFTTGDYNVLRVIAAYPQNAVFPEKTVRKNKRPTAVEAALMADKHPIAILKHVPLCASLSLDPEYPPALQFLDESPAPTKADAKAQ